MRIIYSHAGGRGWDTVTLMARLAAELFEAELLELRGDRMYSQFRLATGLLPRRRGRDHCLVIASHPMHLSAILRSEHWLRGFEHVSGWVIDSFWDDRIPHVARHRGHFDHLFITDAELVDVWQSRTGVPTTWLPFASDVLRMGSSNLARPVDLQLVGRQPSTWDDDASTALACAEAGVLHANRPPFESDPTSNQHVLLRAMASTKFTLSFSNRVSPAPYTHPTREYLTARWTDALASGAIVAGVAPDCAATNELLWPEALLDLGTVDRRSGLEMIAEAASAWAPQRAQLNYRRALERLDWRWRFQQLARTVGITSARLDAEVAELKVAISKAP